MSTITLSRKEYERLKQYSSAYLRIAEEIAKAERAYPYDYKYISALARGALLDHKKGRTVEAKSVDAALEKFKSRRRK